MPQVPRSPEDVATAALDPAAVVQSSRIEWRRSVGELVAQTARIMSARDTTTAERVRLASLVEILVRALENI